MDSTRTNNNLREPFCVETNDETESLSVKLTDNIENIVEAVQSLEDYAMLLGTKNDTKTMRKKMKSHIIETSESLRRTADILKQFEALKPKRKEEVDFRNKILKRTKENYNKQDQKFNKIFKDIQSKEKIYLEARKSVDCRPTNNSNHHVNDLESDIQIQTQDLDFTEALLKERESDIQEVRKLAHELNITAQMQAQKIQEGSDDILIIQENVEDSEKNAEKGNKHLDEVLKNQKKMSTRNVICLLVLLAICGGVVAFVFIQRSGASPTPTISPST